MLAHIGFIFSIIMSVIGIVLFVVAVALLIDQIRHGKRMEAFNRERKAEQDQRFQELEARFPQATSISLDDPDKM